MQIFGMLRLDSTARLLQCLLGIMLCCVLDAFAKLRQMAVSFVMSVRLLGTSRLDVFSLNLILAYFSTIFQENPSFFKIGEE